MSVLSFGRKSHLTCEDRVRPSQSAHGKKASVGIALITLSLLLTACASEPVSSTDASDKHRAASETHTPAVTEEPLSGATNAQDRAASDAPAALPPAGFDRTAQSIEDPASLWVVSNKLRPLQPPQWAPTDLEMPQGVENSNAQPLRAPAAQALTSLVQQAAADGVRLGMISGYRTYDYQAMLYAGYIARDGQLAADTYSARPGHSEHQTGLAVDVDDFSGCMLNACFGQTAAGLWVADHAAEFGFVIRYPEGADAVTGFTYEPWHLRYVGVELAQEMRQTGVTTLEEFFGLSPAPDYAGV